MEKIKKGWSICIVANDGQNNFLFEMVKSILSAFKGVDNYEILIIGNSYYNFKEKEIRQVPFRKNHFFKPGLNRTRIRNVISQRSLSPLLFKSGPICHKKNLAARLSKFDKLCITHDYIHFLEGWKEGFDYFGSEWDICQNIILDYEGNREKDWLLWDHPSLICGKNKISPCLLPYDINSSYMYVSGTYFCVKRRFFLENPLNEDLFWGEGEDVEWSKRVRQQTKFRMNINSRVKFLKKKTNIPQTNIMWKKNHQQFMALPEELKWR